MNDSFKLAMQLTMVDMLSGAAQVARRNILGMGAAGKQVQRDFDQMTMRISRGLKAIAVANYGFDKIKPGVAAAADLQESLIDVRMSLMRSGKDAATLSRELAAVRSTAVDLQKITPFSATDVVNLQKDLLTSGLEFSEVIGKGAARAAMMLATITKVSPEEAGDAMLNVGIPYGLKSNQYGRLGDVLQRHVMSGRMKIPDFNTNLKYVAGVAAGMKIPWEDLLTGMAVLGEHGMASNAGIEMKDFLERMIPGNKMADRTQRALNQELRGMGKSPLTFWDAGKLKPMHTIIVEMREALKDLTDKKRQAVLKKIFETRGALAANALLQTGVGSWEFIKDKVENVAGAEEKMTERLKGFTANVTSLQGTMKSSAAIIFDPWLDNLTSITKLANTAVDAVGKLADRHPVTNNVVQGTAAAALSALIGYGVYNLARGGIAGSRVLRGLRGMGGSALGIAEGKAIQAATGVQSVFVVNWPGNLGGGSGSVAQTMAAVVGAKGVAKALPWLKGAGNAAALGMAGELAAAGAAGVGGFAAGSWFEKKYIKGAIGEAFYDVFNAHNDPDVRRRAAELHSKNEINLQVSIDANGRVTTSSNNMDTYINTMPRGDFFNQLAWGR